MKLNDIKISVITPTYNVGKYVANTIKSILNQTHKNVELIIVDDCSSDNTAEVVNSITDNRIVFLQNNKNNGAAYCRNIAIKKATGDYIAFLDGDDLWLPNKLKKQLEYMINNNYYFTYTKYGVLNNNEELYEVSGPPVINHSLFLRCDFIGCLTVMYKRSVYPNLCIPNDIFKRNDYALWLKLSEKSKCYLLNEKLSLYNKRNDSVSSGKKIQLLKFHFILFKKLYNFNSLKCGFYALRNAVYFILKSIFYLKKRI